MSGSPRRGVHRGSTWSSLGGSAALLAAMILCAVGCRREAAQGRSGPTVESSERTSQVVAVPSVDSVGPDELLLGSADSGAPPLGAQSDAGQPRPTPLREDRAEPSDTLTARDLQGMAMEAEWQLAPMPGALPPIESPPEVLEALRRATAQRMRLELGVGGRLRLVLLGVGHPLGEGTELRARTDRFGHFLVFPEGDRYRHVLPGALRALFFDRRLDVGTVFVPKLATGAPGRLHGWPSQRQRLSTPLGEVELETVALKDEQLQGSLVCRLLTELVGVDPASLACAGDAVPLRAHFTFAGGGSLNFAVTQISKHAEFTESGLAAPPTSAQLVTSGLPIAQTEARLNPLLRRLRAHPPGPAAPGLAETGLFVSNHSPLLRGLVIDGVLVAWVAPNSSLALGELAAGNYAVGTRDFAGSAVDPLRRTPVPSRFEIGQSPARTSNAD